MGNGKTYVVGCTAELSCGLHYCTALQAVPEKSLASLHHASDKHKEPS